MDRGAEVNEEEEDISHRYEVVVAGVCDWWRNREGEEKARGVGWGWGGGGQG